MTDLKQILLDLKEKASTAEGRIELQKLNIGGICTYVDYRTRNEPLEHRMGHSEKLRALVRKWEHFDWFTGLPSALDEFKKHANDAFNADLEYNARRMHLLDHYINGL